MRKGLILLATIMTLAKANIELEESQKIFIFSDWDDTLACSGSGLKGWVAGVDRSCEAGQIYKGSMETLSRLSPKFVICSANPKPERHQLPEKIELLDKGAKENGEQAPELIAILPGKKRDNIYQVNATSLYLQYAKRKFENIKRYIEENSDALQDKYLLFTGDNGQGDVHAAQLLLERGVINEAWIRKVTPKPTLSMVNVPNLHYFDNWDSEDVAELEKQILNDKLTNTGSTNDFQQSANDESRFLPFEIEDSEQDLLQKPRGWFKK